jgi:ribosomal protein S21
MQNQVKIANRNFKRAQRRKKRLEARSKNETFEQYTNRKKREHKANHRRERYEANDNDL